MNNNKQILIYGIGGAEKAYAVIGYYCIFTDDISVTTIMNAARWLRAKNPSIKQIYMIDNRRGLKKDFQTSMRVNSIESHMIFKDILEREGSLLNL